MKTRIYIIGLLLLFFGEIFSQTSVFVDLHKNSWLSINGTTNIVSFRLMHNGEKLLSKPINIKVTQDRNKIYTSKNLLSINVNNFTSNNKMALRDFLKLIKSETYPNLQVQLNYVELQNSNIKNKYTTGNASVIITITGISKQYSIPIGSTQVDDYIKIDGGKKINIQDFGLEPPVEMLGLIKVSEWINIDFHLVCKLSFENPSQLAQKHQ